MCSNNMKDIWELLVFKALLSIFPGRKKKTQQIKKVSGPLPGIVLVTFLQLAFTVNPFPPD